MWAEVSLPFDRLINDKIKQLSKRREGGCIHNEYGHDDKAEVVNYSQLVDQFYYSCSMAPNKIAMPSRPVCSVNYFNKTNLC